MDEAFKQKYQKYKLRVKLWEKDFKKSRGRVPSKYDINEAPQEIRDSYKMYYKLKTSFLEDTLNDVFMDDGFNVLEILGSHNGSHCENVNSSLPLDISTIVDSSTTSFANLEESAATNSMNVINLDENQRAIKDFEAIELSHVNAKAWGSNVSMQSEEGATTNDKNMTRKSFKSNLNQKLFKTNSFSKRNPRKSLSRTNLDASVRTAHNLNESIDTREVLPDFETILTQKAKEQPVSAAITINPLLLGDKTKGCIKTLVDEKWLSRTAALNSIADGITESIDVAPRKASNVALKNNSTDSNARQQTYGISNLDVRKILPKLKTDTIEVGLADDIQVHEKTVEKPEQPKKSKTVMKIPVISDSESVVYDSESAEEQEAYRSVVKRRRILTASGSSTSIPTKLDSPNLKNKSVDETVKINDTEKDFSHDEDNDEYLPPAKNSKVKRKKVTAKTRALPTKKIEKKTLPKKLNKKEVKKKNDETKPAESLDEKPFHPEDLKYSLALECSKITSVPRANLAELEFADKVANRYINTVAPLVARQENSMPIPAANEKRNMERQKLEAKIKAGKLNENFVTIDIQKKKFVRGKKTVNYSKYKKKLWKDKKRVAALTGPNMDMRGCDGGVLKCFTCGQTGHFAQNCKIKGDTLLPLTAQLEEDPSPFPTLEEAEIMATQTAVAVHSRNISKLPGASNSAFYSNNNKGNEVEESQLTVENLNKDDDSDEDESDNADLRMDTDDELEGMDLDAYTANDLIKNKVTMSEETEETLPIKQQYVGHKIPADFLEKAGLNDDDTATKFCGVGPLYDLNADGTVKDVTPEVLEALHMFGHTDFRKGQDRAIMRILSGVSTLVTLSTGSGKSLCYQLPAYLYSRQKKSITLVISPLVSLMEDQVTGVPHFLRAHCLHTNQTPAQRVKILQMIADGEIDILLVSPEAVVAGERSTGFGAILRQLPQIAFACIDEAHCVSQWSHNFRPSYLMICKVLQKNLGVRTVLGLTATATLPTRISIIEHLGIPDGERGIISDVPLPDNLVLSVSKDENRDAALLELLTSKRFDACQSIIIYCTRRDECERISTFLRTCLRESRVAPDEDEKKKKRKRIVWQAEPYHAGMASSRRRTIQNAFMKNELRIVVATIAFGMGINKPDIRAIIHYNMPRSFESYVQEVGRAGRDGKLSHCHLFLDSRGRDQNELRRHIYANSIDRHVIRKLLMRIFIACSCDKNLENTTLIQKEQQHQKQSNWKEIQSTRMRVCPGHEIGFSNEQTVEALDIPAENISTLLCYLELDKKMCINVLSSAYIMAKVISYGGSQYLKNAAKQCPPLAMAIALQIKKNTFKEDANIIEFSVVDIASAIGWNSGVVKYQLKNLEWLQVNGLPKRSPITVSFSELGFRINAPGDFTAEEIDNALDYLYDRSVKQEKTQLLQLQYTFQGLSSVAYNSYFPCTSDKFSTDRSDQLKGIIRNYFHNDYPKDMQLEIDTTSVPDDHINNDVHGLINMYPENNFSGRNVARIFHGISSPNYPALMWSRCKYWRAHCITDFNRIVQLANAVIVQRRT